MIGDGVGERGGKNVDDIVDERVDETISRRACIIGGGPAGLMAAEVLSNAGVLVDVYESMPTLGRKFLRAGLGGLNITHSEPFAQFCKRYGDNQSIMQPYLDKFSPDALREWVHALGIETFVGSSGRVFPKEMKAAPLLRAWVHRLRNAGVQFHFKHRFIGFSERGDLRILDESSIARQNENAGESETGVKEILVSPGAQPVVLALGGASWPQLGSTGEWLEWLAARGVAVAPWQSANCGFDVDWSAHMREKFAHAPLKSVAITFADLDGVSETRQGEVLIRDYGIEGSLIYAFSRRIRDYLNIQGEATFTLDLQPAVALEKLTAELSRPRGSKSMSRILDGVFNHNALKRALLYEVVSREQMNDAAVLAQFIKALPVTVRATRPIAEVISSAGGICFEGLDDNLMLKNMPGVFVAGEMLDWEAPTGGYLLTGCFATGARAGYSALARLG